MSRLALYLLGPPRLELDGEPIQVGRRKAMALLAYLAVTGRIHSRDSLAALLWPEYDQRSARAELRRALSVLSRTLGDEWFTADRETVGLNPAVAPSTGPWSSVPGTEGSGQALWLDVDQFRQRLETCETHGHPARKACPDCLALLTEAAALYQDDFMAGFTLRDSPPFDEWQRFETEGLRDELASALERLAGGHSAGGEYEPAIGYARRWLALDPLHELTHRVLMQLYARAGQRGAALRQYQECVRLLEAELDLPPSAETTSLYEHIRTSAADRADGEEPLFPAPLPRHNLPAQTTPFVGREAVLAEIAERLQDPACRLLTLVGPGGSGKTRLALEAAAARLEEYEHGTFFVPLAPLQSAESIVPTVTEALGIRFYDAGPPRRRLLDYLRQKSMLLIMDNFEHLLPPAGESDEGGAGLMTDILKTAPDVKILTTSRARLNVQGEHLCPIGGMDLPPLPSPEDGKGGQPQTVGGGEGEYSAVKLFLTSARRVEPGFELMVDNVTDVVRICRVVEGMPLGILLAAAWAAMLTPAEIVAQIRSSLDFLETRLRDIPERQRSMRATFDHSWRLLTQREREVFQALSVFRGGFTQEAAQEVTGASLRTLLGLVNKSFLERTPTGRYQVHELLRQYAQEKLDQEPTASQAVHDRHCAYYVAALEQWEANLKGPRQQAALAEMDVEIENARAAWNWAAERRQVERLDQAIEGLCFFYDWRGRWQGGEAACRLAAGRLAPAASFPERSRRVERLRVLARTLVWQSAFCHQLGRTDLPEQLLQQSLALLESPELAGHDTRIEEVILEAGMTLLESPELAGHDTRSEKAFVLLRMGIRGSVPSLEQSLALYRALDDQWWSAYVLIYLGVQAAYRGDYGKAKQLCEESLALYQALGDQKGTAEALLILGWATRQSGDCGEAKRLTEESLALYQALGAPEGISLSLQSLAYIALYRGQFEEAERLARECIAISREIGYRHSAAAGLRRLGMALISLGKYAEAHSALEEGAAIYTDMGWPFEMAYSNVWLGRANVHLGRYEQARALGQMCLNLAREHGYRREIGLSLFLLGDVALAGEAYAEAQGLLQESVTILREIGHRPELGPALTDLGAAARGLGQLPQARQHLHEALRTGAEIEAFIPLILVLPAAALLLSDQSEPERAVELYALASRYPMVASSRWFEDVAGQHIAAVAATLPPEVVAAAQERGRARDLQATVAELLAELGERG